MNKHEMSLKAACNNLDNMFDLLEDTARKYIRESVIEVSRRFPKRTIRFVSAMGSSTLYISLGGFHAGAYDDYAIDAYQEPVNHVMKWKGHELLGAFDFLNKLDDIENKYRHYNIGGPVYIVCKGGEIIEEKEDW